jgi:xylulokinase
MPGFTAPKLQWVRENEPDIFAKVAKGPAAEGLRPAEADRRPCRRDVRQRRARLWLDVAARDWSDDLLAATGLSRRAHAAAGRGIGSSGQVRKELCERWGMTSAPVVAGGGGDNAASACGVGAIEPGSAFVSLGTSGVLFVTNDRFSPNAESAVHAFCHAVPDTWHQMGVILSATDSLNWYGPITGHRPGA